MSLCMASFQVLCCDMDIPVVHHHAPLIKELKVMSHTEIPTVSNVGGIEHELKA